MGIFKGLKSLNGTNIMFDQLALLSDELESENNREALGRIIRELRADLFPSFREATEILEKPTYLGISVTEMSVVHVSRRGRCDGDSKSRPTKLKQLLIFAQQYVAALWNNLTSRLKCLTITPGAYSEPCQTFKMERFAKIVNSSKS